MIFTFLTQFILHLFMQNKASCGQVYIFCIKDQIKYMGKNLYPISFKNNEKNQTDYVFKENPEFLEYVTAFNQQQFIDNNTNIIYSKIQNERLISILNQENDYLFQIQDLKLIIKDDQELDINMNLIYSSSYKIENCFKIIGVFYHRQLQIILICEQINEYLITVFSIKQQVMQIEKSIEIQKQSECLFDVIFQENISQMLFIYYNCLNWDVVTFHTNKFDLIYAKNVIKLSIQSDFLRQIYMGELRKVSFTIQDDITKNFDKSETYYFHFDHNIVQFQYNISDLNLVYENREMKILDFQIKNTYQIIILQDENTYQTFQTVNDKSNIQIIITKQYQPQQMLIFTNSIVLIYKTYIEMIVRSDLIYKLDIKLESIQTINFYPFLIGKINNQFIIVKINGYSPFINCNDYINQSTIYLAESNLLKKNQVFQNEIIHSHQIDFNQPQNLTINDYINEEEFTVDLKFDKIRSFFPIPKIEFLQNDVIECEEQSQTLISECLGSKSLDTLWQAYIIHIKKVRKLVQLRNLQIIIILCESEETFNVGFYEKIKEENIYNFQNEVFLLTNSRRKIINIKFIATNKYVINIFEFKDAIQTIIPSKFDYEIVLESCTSYLFQNGHIVNTQNFKLDSDKQCNQVGNLKVGFMEINLQNQVFIFKEKYITKYVSFQNQTIHHLYQFSFDINLFLVISSFGNKFIVTQYQYHDFQLITLSQVFNQTLNYAQPFKYQINTFYLVIATFNNQNKSILLIYGLQLIEQQQLIDVIYVDNFTFILTEFQQLYFFHQNTLKIYNIQQILFKCKLSQFNEYLKSIIVPILRINKLNETMTQLDTIKFNLINNFQKLNLLSSQKIQLKYHSQQQFIQLDPRKYVFGSIDNISINVNKIISPVNEALKIERSLCNFIENQICVQINDQNKIRISELINPQQKYIYLNLTFQTFLRILNSELYLILFYEKDNYMYLDLYLKATYEKASNLKMNKQKDQSVTQIKMINQYIVISYKDLIQKYQILNNNNVILIGQQICIHCFVYLISEFNYIVTYQTTLMKNQVEFNITDFQSDLNIHKTLVLNQEVLIDQFRQGQFDILKLNLIDTNQYQAKLLIQFSSQQAQVIDIIFNQDSIFVEKYSKIKSKFDTMFDNVLFMSNDQILIIKSYNHMRGMAYISIYNLTQPEIIEQIYQIQLDCQDIQKYNDSHFLVKPANQTSAQILYSVSSYMMEIIDNKIKILNMTIQNPVSNIQLFVELVNEDKNNIFDIKLLILICWEIILICFIRLKNKGFKKN